MQPLSKRLQDLSDHAKKTEYLVDAAIARVTADELAL
jgi:hypothetical protein